MTNKKKVLWSIIPLIAVILLAIGIVLYGWRGSQRSYTQLETALIAQAPSSWGPWRCKLLPNSDIALLLPDNATVDISPSVAPEERRQHFPTNGGWGVEIPAHGILYSTTFDLVNDPWLTFGIGFIPASPDTTMEEIIAAYNSTSDGDANVYGITVRESHQTGTSVYSYQLPIDGGFLRASVGGDPGSRADLLPLIIATARRADESCQ